MRLAARALVALAGCQKAPGPISNIREKVEVGQGDVEGCIHRKAYQLVPAPDASTVVAKAVVQGCHAAIVKRVQTNIAEDYARGNEFLSEIESVSSSPASMGSIARLQIACRVVSGSRSHGDLPR